MVGNNENAVLEQTFLYSKILFFYRVTVIVAKNARLNDNF